MVFVLFGALASVACKWMLDRGESQSGLVVLEITNWRLVDCCPVVILFFSGYFYAWFIRYWGLKCFVIETSVSAWCLFSSWALFCLHQWHCCRLFMSFLWWDIPLLISVPFSAPRGFVQWGRWSLFAAFIEQSDARFFNHTRIITHHLLYVGNDLITTEVTFMEHYLDRHSAGYWIGLYLCAVVDN